MQCTSSIPAEKDGPVWIMITPAIRAPCAMPKYNQPHCLDECSPLNAFEMLSPQLSVKTTTPNTAHMTAGSFWRECHGPVMSMAYADAGN